MPFTRFCFLLFALTATLTTHAGEVTVIRDIAYLGPEREEKLDLYLPACAQKNTDGKRFPAVVIIHGGGWVSGDKGQRREREAGTTLAEAGYVGISINYQLAGKRPDGTTLPSWPTNLHDCKRAVQYLRKNASRLHVDPDRIGVLGGSAGAHLALLVGLTDLESGLDPEGPDKEISCRVQAVVDMYGWSSIEAYGHTMIGKTLEEAPKAFQQGTPTTHASADDPPVLILHGTADTLIPVYHAHHLEQAFQEAGIEFETRIVIGGPHSFRLLSDEADLRPLVLRFLDKHLKRAKSQEAVSGE